MNSKITEVIKGITEEILVLMKTEKGKLYFFNNGNATSKTLLYPSSMVIKIEFLGKGLSE